MTLVEFKSLLLRADAGTTKWKGAGTGNYTVWSPFLPIGLMADGIEVESGWRIQVDRFTKNPDDTIINAISSALQGNDDIAVSVETTTFEPDTGYFHFFWICEVV